MPRISNLGNRERIRALQFRNPRQECAMILRALLPESGVRATSGNLDIEVTGIAYDSRKAESGSVFVAVRGEQVDGNRFIAEAVARGARAIVSSAAPSLPQPGVAAWIEVADDRAALAAIASNFYGRPTRDLHLIGITGTNGKTTTAYLVESILHAAGHPAAVMGTIEYRGPGFQYGAERTTPEAPDLEQLFRRVVDAGWKYSVIEVSSHSIELKRVAGLYFDVAVFTNLSRDHLDFHGDMRSYFLAKKKLFTSMAGGIPRKLVLNHDDSNFEELRQVAPDRVISYGMESASEICPRVHHFEPEGTEATFKTPLGDIAIRSRLMGTPNLFNMGAAIGVAAALGIAPRAIRQGIEALDRVPGRFDFVNAGQPYRVIVDYAHTDDALQKILASAREITSGRLIVVFGCGGDRDKTKRPLMGEAAANGADFVVITSDNPRSEDPAVIISEIEKGVKRAGGAAYEVCPDRRDAIRSALKAAHPGDTVVIAGKGHEAYQVIGKETFPFDDRAVARELIDEINAGRNN